MKKRTEPILVTRSSLPPMEDYIEKLRLIWDTAWMTNMGPYHEELKEKLKDYLKVDGIELFVNGHTALEMALQAFQMEGEVITTPFSFASTTHAIVRNGLTPVFCDIAPEDFTIDASRLESLITEKTCAILPVHVYGNLCDVETIQDIADRHGLRVIYDAAHTFGEELDGKGAGSFGDASMFSFHATKVYNTIEGGAVAFREPWLDDILYKLKNFGITGKESVEYIGGNGKMNEFQAAMGLCNLKYVDREIKKRQTVAEQYRKRLEGVKGIRLSRQDSRVRYNYAYMPVVFEGFRYTRDEIYDRLAEHNIFARKYFYPCINGYDCYKDRFDPDETPVAKRISHQILTLPIYADLDLEIVDEICDIILDERSETWRNRW